LPDSEGDMSEKKTASPVDVYELLPGTNCQKCGQKNCMTFASKLVNKEASLEECRPLLDKANEEAYRELWRLLMPPVKQVTIGTGDTAVKIGGEYVMYRHELAYINPTAIAIDVTDELPHEELLKRIKRIEGFTYTYLGQKLRLDLLAIRSVSDNPARFAATVKTVAEHTCLSLVLCSYSPSVLKAGLEFTPDRRPLLYAATRSNWKEMAQLALNYRCPLTVSALNDLNFLRSLTKTVVNVGVKDIILDPGTSPYAGFQDTVRNFNMLRWMACKEGDELLGFPLLGTPIAAWAKQEGASEAATWREATVASMLITHYANLLIIHSLDGWALLPIVILRQNLYTDPRKPAAVEPGLRIFGDPDENSPVMFTTNFSLTYFTVSSDIESSPISNRCYLLVLDSEGIGVRTAAARATARKGGLTAEVVAKALKESGIEQKVKHRTLIIPGLLANLGNELERLTGWKALVGPSNSAELPKFLEEHWYKSQKAPN